MKPLTRICALLVLGLILSPGSASAQYAGGQAVPAPLPLSVGEDGALIRAIDGHRTVHGLQPAEQWPEPLIQRTALARRDRDWLLEPYRLAVIPVEFSDRPRNPQRDRAFYEHAFFSQTEYIRQPNGARAYGSANDWLIEQSYGKFRLTGQVFDWLQYEEPYSYFQEGRRPSMARFLAGVAERLLEREEDENLLREFDGLAFIIAGPNLRAHKSSLTVGGRRYDYWFKQDTPQIGTHVHEFGHMLGLPDKYGSSNSGLGVWCAMANGATGALSTRSQRPLHLCAWCKIRLGWVQPVVVDPRAAQQLVLRPVQPYQHEAIIIPVNEDGSEFYLLENRQQIGFDRSIHSGLLIWHFGEEGRRQINRLRSVDVNLREAHGRDDQERRSASHLDLGNVPWPRRNRREFTPESNPSSKTNGNGDFTVYLRNIRQENGLIFFDLGPPASR